MPEIAKLASMAGMGGDAGLMVKLMRYRLDPRALSYVSQAKIQVLSETTRSVHYVLTFPDQVTSDETVTITPNQHYTPSSAAPQASKRPGPQVFEPKLTAKKISPTEMQFTLHYYVRQDALPAELVQRIRQSGATAQDGDFFRVVPAAWAQEGGGGNNGAGSVGWNIAEVVKSMGVKGLEHAEWEKAAKGLENILTMKDLIKSYGEIQGWLGEVAELEECAKNPTNPLTAKAAQGQDYQQVLDQLDEASWDIQMTAFPKVANITAGAVTQFLPFGTGVMISPITDANDAAIEQYAEQRIADARKSVVECDKETEMTAFGFRPMIGKFEYKYNDSYRNCTHQGSESGCTFNTVIREAAGSFVIDPGASEESAAATNVGSGYTQEDGGFENPKCHGETHSLIKGPFQITVDARGTPESAMVDLYVGSNQWKGTLDSYQTCGAMPPVHESWDNGSPTVDCKFTKVDMVKGGHFATFSEADHGRGTCVIDLQRK